MSVTLHRWGNSVGLRVPGAHARAASALTHSDATGNLLSLARIEAADAVQTKGRGFALR